ncbi:sigma-70 family RNA polymerase sigma factor [Roseovarius salinarum]|uniref:sigma-70 family RNA polymerase sigma factor n=1 Tax=Roseovarius salinarum TaxID=1981892 RepID=UPI000C34E0EB|nr:sigma-70 family RNA polymerase sigma factor [Roseovarius salinarum]
MNKPVRHWTTRRRQTSEHAMLDAQEERRLIQAWQHDRDETARHQLVQAFTPLAAAMAKRFAPGTSTPDPDLLQQAHIGLLKAADRFDASQDVRFSTYAVWWVRAEIQDFRLANLSVVRRPNTASFRKAFFNLSRVEKEVGAAHPDADDNEARIAAALGLSQEKLGDIRTQLSGSDSSLNAPALEEDGEDRMALLVDPQTDVEAEVSADLDTEKLRAVIVKAMCKLPEREREIIVATYLSDPPETLEALGTRFGISKERVRQLRERGFERLRTLLRNRDLSLESFV